MNSSSYSDPYLEEIDSLLSVQRYEEALVIINNLDIDKQELSSVLRLKSRAQLGLNDLSSSFATLKLLISKNDCSIDDIQEAGERALVLGFHTEAEAYLSDVLTKENLSGDKYYTTSCLLERAYVRVLLRNFAGARSDIDSLKTYEEGKQANIFWLKGIDSITLASVCTMMNCGDASLISPPL